MTSRLTRLTGVAAAALLATTMAAAAQSQTDSRGNAMGSQNVGNGAPHTGTMAPSTTTGMGGKGINGANHPTPSSTQGDTGPRGNNNGTISGNAGR
ncbi:hypothetical protein KQX63_22815 [Rhodopseudomonas palustris]|uniref:hypothetical protein n=1 Tax=Rhodopseudomonas TaxID=1073 RepID=UPI0021F2DF42|nr:hypothetical protein [Rhodopseudomonas palustris]UYO44160.1 hypothetical protein KQX63_22815 [Rhodopseudomonas palustris]UYO48785.1 hypothetical protein KQX64_23255 [Rhodopseudomonas palustris]UYO53532.1 hypothetical protein KQX61_23615 [Rhodopseudomonas palustris]